MQPIDIGGELHYVFQCISFLFFSLQNWEEKILPQLYCKNANAIKFHNLYCSQTKRFREDNLAHLEKRNYEYFLTLCALWYQFLLSFLLCCYLFVCCVSFFLPPCVWCGVVWCGVVCVCVIVCVCVRACVCACVRVCVRARALCIFMYTLIFF